MGCPRLLSCGEPDTLCLGMVPVAPPRCSYLFPLQGADLVCLGGLSRRLARRGGECLLPAVRAAPRGLPHHLLGSYVLVQQFRRNGDSLTSIFHPQPLNLLACWGMPLEDAMLKGADVRIITN